MFFFAMFFNFTQSVALEGSEPENMSLLFGGVAFVFASLRVAVLSGIGIKVFITLYT
jgi:hypothetical protein